MKLQLPFRQTNNTGIKISIIVQIACEHVWVGGDTVFGSVPHGDEMVCRVNTVPQHDGAEEAVQFENSWAS